MNRKLRVTSNKDSNDVFRLDIYEHDTNHRFSLGKSGKSQLVVFGVNPSIATNKVLDQTLKNVLKFSEILGFDSFVMLNLYPQRATNPNDLPKEMSIFAHQKNLALIRKAMSDKATIWAAWGETIEVRDYLFTALQDIYKITKKFEPKWIQYDNLTKSGHPRHPSRKKLENRFKAFDIENYFALQRTKTGHLSGKKC